MDNPARRRPEFLARGLRLLRFDSGAAMRRGRQVETPFFTAAWRPPRGAVPGGAAIPFGRPRPPRSREDLGVQRAKRSGPTNSARFKPGEGATQVHRVGTYLWRPLDFCFRRVRLGWPPTPSRNNWAATIGRVALETRRPVALEERYLYAGSGPIEEDENLQDGLEDPKDLEAYQSVERPLRLLPK